MVCSTRSPPGSSGQPSSWAVRICATVSGAISTGPIPSARMTLITRVRLNPPTMTALRLLRRARPSGSPVGAVPGGTTTVCALTATLLVANNLQQGAYCNKDKCRACRPERESPPAKSVDTTHTGRSDWRGPPGDDLPAALTGRITGIGGHGGGVPAGGP